MVLELQVTKAENWMRVSGRFYETCPQPSRRAGKRSSTCIYIYIYIYIIHALKGKVYILSYIHVLLICIGTHL